MQFLRENLFYVILLGATIVLGGAGLGWYFTSDVNDLLRSRKRLSGQLQRLSNRQQEKVNEEAVKRQKARIKMLHDAAKKDSFDGTAFNKANLSVLKLVVGGVPENAFPINEKRYTDLGLDLVFIKEYTRVLNAMISPTRSDLRPTSLATPEEIRQQAIILKEQFGAQAQEKAIQFMKVQKAKDGLVFIEGDSLDRQFTRETKAGAARLWEAQVNLWVTSEILAAVAATNQEVIDHRKRAGIESGPPSVLNSAVKRLVKVSITESFLTSTGGGFLGAKGATASGLTGRISTSGYGVIPYRFSVIIPPRHVEKLLRNLMVRNYHTITRVAMNKVPDPSAHYYGIEPVMNVAINAELLLLADWIRPLMPPSVSSKLPRGATARPKT